MTYCGVQVCREKPTIHNWDIYVGHEWLELLETSGSIINSAGFWPATDFLWWGFGIVECPDPKSGKTTGSVTFAVTVSSLKTGKMLTPNQCIIVQQSVYVEFLLRKKDPGYYSLILRNCRHWVKEVLDKFNLRKQS